MPDQIHPIGNFIIEHVNNSYEIDLKIMDSFKKYKKIAAITLQKTITEKTMKFVLTAAEMDSEILYLVIPREKLIQENQLPENVRIVTEPNFYELMKYVDVHVTVFSSCAIEAPSLGVRNILINIDGYAKMYYGDTLLDKVLTRFVETPHELVDEIKNMKPLAKCSIIDANSTYISPGYFENLKNYLHELGLFY